MERVPSVRTAAVALLVVVVLGGCGSDADQAAIAPADAGPATSSNGSTAAPTAASPTSTIPTPPSSAPTVPPSGTSTEGAPTSGTPSAAPATEPRASYLTIPALGVRDLRVVRYRGTPDDGPGTKIQDRGNRAASPRGPGGGVGPGDVGNFIVTGHRTAHDPPFRELPSLRKGDRVLVRSAETVYVYEVVESRRTSFRSAQSKARQVAAVPGHPGRTAVEPMITLSTCATPEDVAAGNLWRDEFGNLEHRIDKVGVLVDVRPA